MDAAMREVIAIAKAMQVDLAEADIGEWYKVMDTLDAAGKTSMLQDVEAGRTTEVEMLAGTVIELGRRHGIATPVNERLFEELRRLEGLRIRAEGSSMGSPSQGRREDRQSGG